MTTLGTSQIGVDELGIGLALGGAHDRPFEGVDRAVLAALEIRHRTRIRRQRGAAPFIEFHGIGLSPEPLPVDDPMQRCPDITKAKTLLGWEPKISLRQGLELSLDYFRASLPERAR